LSSLLAHGLYTRQLTPVFPSLTFPNHVSEVTGVRPGVHGIISNRYLDTTDGKVFNMATEPNALRAEPIWFTATRQGVRTAMMDWPLSEAQEKLPADTQHTAYYTPEFNSKLTDKERLEVLAGKYRDDWSKEQPGGPLRLLMGYVYATDKAGHKAGPNAAATTEAIHDIDKAAEQCVHEVADVF
jgi:predicted AlkP superfamily pyrophosphatase or phosphodiesterase